jgi:hypothetical protein
LIKALGADKIAGGGQLGWRMPMCAALAAVLVFIPLVINPNTDFLYLFLIVPGLLVLGVCALIYAAIRKTLRIAVMVTTFWVVSALLFMYNIPIRSFTRWLLWSRQYKSEVLAEPDSKNGDLKHIEWDGWGWGGQDFSVFLVFDPTDSLSGPAKNGLLGHWDFRSGQCTRTRLNRT